MADPKFVRLPERLLSGNWHDIDTGFGISGLDVKEFPEDPDEARAVRNAIRAQLVEPATRAQYDAVQAAHGRLSELAKGAVPAEGALGSQPPWNEASMASVAKTEYKKLVNKRLNENDEGEEEEESNPSDYSSKSKAELVNEVHRRNAERDADSQLEVSGTKDDLVARLEADDRASASA